jgi:hypothetical protein
MSKCMRQHRNMGGRQDGSRGCTGAGFQRAFETENRVVCARLQWNAGVSRCRTAARRAMRGGDNISPWSTTCLHMYVGRPYDSHSRHLLVNTFQWHALVLPSGINPSPEHRRRAHYTRPSPRTTFPQLDQMMGRGAKEKKINFSLFLGSHHAP